MALTHADITALYAEHSPLLLRYLMRRTFDAQAAVELMAETFATAYEKRASCRKPEAARSWIFGIADNLLREFFRSGRTERHAVERMGLAVPEVEDEDLGRIEELAGTSELRAAVAAALRDLSDEHRTALELRVVQERSYLEVAGAMGVSEDVARARVSRALKKMKGVVEETVPVEVIENV
ncbi:MAG: RNA polymerase sigma factor [Thermoleophilaceae bacterium]|nr:RNA polymerase sigma factor [Thermoleophilaceae bacterium]